MENLTTLQQEVLEFSKQLIDVCGRVELYPDKIEEVKNRKYLQLFVSDIADYKIFAKPQNLKDVTVYFQKNGLDFIPSEVCINEGFNIAPFSPEFFRLGKIMGKDIEEIKTKLENIISEFEDKNLETKVQTNKFQIKYNQRQFIFNDSEKIDLSGMQKDVSDCLSEIGIDKDGENKEVSWEEIYEKINGMHITNSGLDKDEQISEKKDIHGYVLEINKKAESILAKLGQTKLLIGSKDNKYWFEYPVEIVG